MAAVHLDNLIFLLFVALAIFFQILTRAASKSRKRPGDTTRRSPSPSQMSRPLSGGADETDEQRIRKFLEALGQPTTSKPPSPVAPRPTYQKPTVQPHVPTPLRSPLPPLTTRPPDLPREIRLPRQIPATREARTFQPRVAEAAAFEVQQGPAPLEPLPIVKTAAEAYAIATKPIATSSDVKIDIATLLRSTSGLRDAIILREIFGPPRSLQPLDLVGSV
ncbi:MAG TPA: hypothetical protein VNW72_06135 [Chthoniobacterales bacterium]|jgi:hypothetical protein|nr:hypothetical protein [Chthoniobacterales bacterium]